ncbi:MAG: PspC domain-containing protein [Bacteroidales bacterium]
MNNRNRIYRSNNKQIAGVCAGIAEYFRFNISLIRLITFILIFFGGVSIWVYILLWIIIPSQNNSGNGYFENRNRRRYR